MAYVHRMGLAVIAPELEAAFQLSAVALGLLGAAYFYPYSVMQIPVGILVDAIGPRTVLVVFVAIGALGSTLFGMGGSYELALLGRFMVGLGVAAIYLSAQRLFINWFDPRQFATLSGFLNAAGNLGGIFASLPLVALSVAFGWQHVFVVAGGIMLGVAVLSAVAIKDCPSEQEGRYSEPRRGSEAWAAVRQGAGIVASKGYVWPLAAGLLPFVGTRFAFQGLWGGPYLTEIYRLSAEEVGTLMMLMSLSVVVSSPVSGYLSDRVFRSRKWFAVGGMAANALCWVPLAFATDRLPVSSFYIIVILLGAFSTMWLPVYAQAKELHSPAVAGTVLAILQFATSFGGAVYQQLLGIVIGFFEKTPAGYPVAAYSAAFGFCLASAVFAALMILVSKEAR